MRVYVATKFEDREIAAKWLDYLRKFGIDVSHDWPAVEEVSDLSSHPIERRQYAEDDLRGVATADVVWVLAPAEGGRGCWTEMGIAIGLRIPFLVSGEGVGKNLFDEFAGATFPTHMGAAIEIRRLAGR